MAKIPENQLNRLRNAGLFISEPAPSTHVMPDFVSINKPKEVNGNCIPNFSTKYDIDGKVEFDAPYVTLHFDQKWIVEAMDHAPTLGPGDLVNQWETIEEAVNDILDFYFGDPERMNEKARRKAEVRARIESYREQS